MEKTEIIGIAEAGGSAIEVAVEGNFLASGIAFRNEGQTFSHVVRITAGTVEINDCEFSGAKSSEENLGCGLLITRVTRGTVRNCVALDNGVGIKLDVRANAFIKNCRSTHNIHGFVFTWFSSGQLTNCLALNNQHHAIRPHG